MNSNFTGARLSNLECGGSVLRALPLALLVVSTVLVTVTDDPVIAKSTYGLARAICKQLGIPVPRGPR